MRLGFTNVERYTGGIGEWTLAGRYVEVAGKAGADAALGAGGQPVDLRPLVSWLAGHLPGATHAPADSILADPAAALPGADTDAVILLYGDGGADGEASRAAAALQEQGFGRIRLYTGGVADWIAGGGALE